MNRYVAYIAAPQNRAHTSIIQSAQNEHHRKIDSFITAHPGQLCDTYLDSCSSNQRHTWPQLEKALARCLQEQAHLIISELGHLTRNENFSKKISNFLKETSLELFCLDQPFINRTNFESIVAFAKEQSLQHSRLIKEGLLRTQGHSGNPQAIEQLEVINKPKIENAIVFSLLLMPIIHEYEAKGYSQRRMVEMLNEEGYHAPKGGPWVLSQLQKVLKRMKVSEIALVLEADLKAYRAQDLNSETIVNRLNQGKINPPQGSLWTEDNLQEIETRLEQIQDIIAFNQYMIAVIPMLTGASVDTLSDEQLISCCTQAGMPTPKRNLQTAPLGGQHVSS